MLLIEDQTKSADRISTLSVGMYGWYVMCALTTLTHSLTPIGNVVLVVVVVILVITITLIKNSS